MFDTVVKSVNGILWGEGQVLIYILLFAGIWFSVRLKVSAHLSSALSYNRSLAAHSTALGR